MANFEYLIKKALGTQDASSQDVRDRVYQSSRNALQKIIDSNRSLSLEEAISQKQELEGSIERIEAEYHAPPPPKPELAQPAEQPFIIPPAGMAEEQAEPPKPKLVDEDDPLYEIQQILTGKDIQPPKPEPLYPTQEVLQESEQVPSLETNQPDAITSVNEPNFEEVDASIHLDGVEADELEEFVEPHIINDEITLNESDQTPLQFKQRRGKQKRWFGWLAFLIIILLLIWLAVYAYRGVMDGSLLGLNGEDQQSLQENINDENYISILTPNDSTSLIVAGRGKAELITQQNTNMLRLISERDAADLSAPAQPILIRLKPGVLQQIANKTVTVEIFAKSGDSDQAQFSVSCDFANGGGCGRKRFVTGIQPQASVFNFEFGDVPDENAEYFLAINTDTTAESAQTGKGSMLDVIYARIRVN